MYLELYLYYQDLIKKSEEAQIVYFAETESRYCEASHKIMEGNQVELEQIKQNSPPEKIEKTVEGRDSLQSIIIL